SNGVAAQQPVISPRHEERRLRGQGRRVRDPRARRWIELELLRRHSNVVAEEWRATLLKDSGVGEVVLELGDDWTAVGAEKTRRCRACCVAGDFYRGSEFQLRSIPRSLRRPHINRVPAELPVCI